MLALESDRKITLWEYPMIRSAGVLVFVISFALPSWAVQRGDAGFQDAVLVRYENVLTGTNCQTSGSPHSEGTGDGTVETQGTATTECSDVFYRHYIIRVGENTYVLARSSSRKSQGFGLATLGWAHAFEKESVLANLLLGTQLKVRTDADGFHIKVGKRESLFKVLAAQ